MLYMRAVTPCLCSRKIAVVAVLEFSKSSITTNVTPASIFKICFFSCTTDISHGHFDRSADVCAEAIWSGCATFNYDCAKRVFEEKCAVQNKHTRT
jgi:hypothetical protein